MKKYPEQSKILMQLRYQTMLTMNTFSKYVDIQLSRYWRLEQGVVELTLLEYIKISDKYPKLPSPKEITAYRKKDYSIVT